MGILDAPGLSKTTAFRNTLVPMATRCAPSFQTGNGLSDGVLCGGTAKQSHVAVRTAHGLRLVYSNHYSNVSAVEASGPNVITIKASIENPGGTIFPVTFNGSDSIELAPGANVVSDVVGIEIAKGTTFYTRTFVLVNPGEFFVRGCFATGSSGTASWHNYANPAGADLTGSATNVSSGFSEYVLGPSAILGKSIDSGKSVIGIVGDSIAAGTGDNQTGWVERLLGGGYSLQKVAYPSETVQGGWLGSNGQTRYRRYGVLELAGVTHVVAEHIVNDLGQTLPTMQANALLYWTNLSRLGTVYATTCTPQTTSTDAWATVGNQTIADGTKEAKRIAYNAWLRDGAPISAGVAVAVGTGGATRAGQTGHPLAGYLEAADGAESARDSGKWKAGYTADGTHPSATGAAGIAATLSATTYFGAVSV